MSGVKIKCWITVNRHLKKRYEKWSCLAHPERAYLLNDWFTTPPCKSLRILLQELIYEPSRQPGGPKRHRVKDQKSADTAYQDSTRICLFARMNELRAGDNHYINAHDKLLFQYDHTYFCQLLPKRHLILFSDSARFKYIKVFDRTGPHCSSNDDE